MGQGSVRRTSSRPERTVLHHFVGSNQRGMCPKLASYVSAPVGALKINLLKKVAQLTRYQRRGRVRLFSRIKRLSCARGCVGGPDSYPAETSSVPFSKASARSAIASRILSLNAFAREPSQNRSFRTNVVSSIPKSSQLADAIASLLITSFWPSGLCTQAAQSKFRFIQPASYSILWNRLARSLNSNPGKVAGSSCVPFPVNGVPLSENSL